MKVILSGGGTGGPTMPLVAVAQALRHRHPDVHLLWVGTYNGPEREMVAYHQIPFRPIYSGKLRRYFSTRNLTDLFCIALGFFQSLYVLRVFHADVIVSAGGFVSVPLAWAGWLLRRSILIHQQDVRPGLANRLMAPFASRITVTFERSLNDFERGKTHWTGNPVRAELLQGDPQKALSFFNLEPDVPCVLVIGGGTGARRLNEIVWEATPDLVRCCQLIHLTGRYKEGATRGKRYRPYVFLGEELAWAYAAAEVVVSRGGLSTLSELAVLGKPTIIVPIRNSHQEENACWFEQHGAAVCIQEDRLTPDRLTERIRDLIESPIKRQRLSNAIFGMNRVDAAERLAREIEELAEYN